MDSTWSKHDEGLLKAVMKRNKKKIVNLLTSSCADPTKLSPTTHSSAAHFSVESGYDEEFNLMFHQIKNINCTDNEGRTLLHIACISGRDNITAQLLQEATVRSDQLDGRGLSALHYACSHGNMGCVQLVCQHVDVNSVDKHGWTPLFYAAARGSASICRLLLERGAHINIRDEENRTALMTSVKHRSTFEFLLSKGADLHAADNEGHTAEWYAVAEGCEETMRLLVEQRTGQYCTHPAQREILVQNRMDSYSPQTEHSTNKLNGSSSDQDKIDGTAELRDDNGRSDGSLRGSGSERSKVSDRSKVSLRSKVSERSRVSEEMSHSLVSRDDTSEPLSDDHRFDDVTQPESVLNKMKSKAVNDLSDWRTEQEYNNHEEITYSKQHQQQHQPPHQSRSDSELEKREKNASMLTNENTEQLPISSQLKTELSRLRASYDSQLNEMINNLDKSENLDYRLSGELTPGIGSDRVDFLKDTSVEVKGIHSDAVWMSLDENPIETTRNDEQVTDETLTTMSTVEKYFAIKNANNRRHKIDDEDLSNDTAELNAIDYSKQILQKPERSDSDLHLNAGYSSDRDITNSLNIKIICSSCSQTVSLDSSIHFCQVCERNLNSKLNLMNNNDIANTSYNSKLKYEDQLMLGGRSFDESRNNVNTSDMKSDENEPETFVSMQYKQSNYNEIRQREHITVKESTQTGPEDLSPTTENTSLIVTSDVVSKKVKSHPAFESEFVTQHPDDNKFIEDLTAFIRENHNEEKDHQDINEPVNKDDMYLYVERLLQIITELKRHNAVLEEQSKIEQKSSPSMDLMNENHDENQVIFHQCADFDSVLPEEKRNSTLQNQQNLTEVNELLHCSPEDERSENYNDINRQRYDNKCDNLLSNNVVSSNDGIVLEKEQNYAVKEEIKNAERTNTNRLQLSDRAQTNLEITRLKNENSRLLVQIQNLQSELNMRQELQKKYSSELIKFSNSQDYNNENQNGMALKESNLDEQNKILSTRKSVDVIEYRRLMTESLQKDFERDIKKLQRKNDQLVEELRQKNVESTELRNVVNSLNDEKRQISETLENFRVQNEALTKEKEELFHRLRQKNFIPSKKRSNVSRLSSTDQRGDRLNRDLQRAISELEATDSFNSINIPEPENSKLSATVPEIPHITNENQQENGNQDEFEFIDNNPQSQEENFSQTDSANSHSNSAKSSEGVKEATTASSLTDTQNINDTSSKTDRSEYDNVESADIKENVSIIDMQNVENETSNISVCPQLENKEDKADLDENSKNLIPDSAQFINLKEEQSKHPDNEDSIRSESLENISQIGSEAVSKVDRKSHLIIEQVKNSDNATCSRCRDVQYDPDNVNLMQLKSILKEHEKREKMYNQTIQAYRSHLLAAVHGCLDKEVQDVLLRIVHVALVR